MEVDKRLAPHIHHVVLIEGGTIAIKRYKRLMLRRIKWSDKSYSDSEESAGSEDAEIKQSQDSICHLVWEGVTNKP